MLHSFRIANILYIFHHFRVLEKVHRGKASFRPLFSKMTAEISLIQVCVSAAFYSPYICRHVSTKFHADNLKWNIMLLFSLNRTRYSPRSLSQKVERDSRDGCHAELCVFPQDRVTSCGQRAAALSEYNGRAQLNELI